MRKLVDEEICKLANLPPKVLREDTEQGCRYSKIFKYLKLDLLVYRHRSRILCTSVHYLFAHLLIYISAHLPIKNSYDRELMLA